MESKSISNSLNSSQIDEINHLIDKVSYQQKQDFGNIVSDIKPDGTLITDCDRWSDENLVQGLMSISKGDGVLSEEGSKIVPDSSSFWVIDPLDGTTNFAAGIPYWSISIARLSCGEPDIAFLEIPALKKRIFAKKGQGVWINNKKITYEAREISRSSCISLCSRSIKILQQNPNQTFPGKIRLLGVASLNMVSVGIGQTIGAIEATPKIWDLAAAWLILSELKCPIKWLVKNPSLIKAGQDLSNVSFPLITADSEEQLLTLAPWGEALIKTS